MNPVESFHRYLDKLPRFAGWTRWPLFGLQMALGIMFILSGATKALDSAVFLETLPLYGLPQWLVPAGLLIPPIEIALGTALIFSIALPVTIAAIWGLLLLFSILLIPAIFIGEMESCGCFGQYLELSPGWALVRNVGLLVVVKLLYLAHYRPAIHWAKWHLGILMIILLLGGVFTGQSNGVKKVDRSAAMVGAFLPDAGFTHEDLTLEGEQLVFVFAVSCHHCWDGVENVKAIARDGKIPIIGVTGSDKYEIEWFIEAFDINFPIYPYAMDQFLTDYPYWPALYYLQDGMILGTIEDEIPAPRTLMEDHLPGWAY